VQKSAELHVKRVGSVVSNKSKTKTALSMLIVSLVILMYSWFNSNIFITENLEWTGLHYLDSNQLDSYINMAPTNVWRLDTGDLIGTLVDHPWIDSAKISWRWPNRIMVNITECEPIAQIPTPAGWILMDGEGKLLPPTSSTSVYHLPIVNNLDLDSAEQIRSTARVMKSIPRSLHESISEWNVQTRTFIDSSGTEILMGQAVELGEKFRLLEQILNDLAQKNAKAKKIDLRVPRNPVVTIL